MLYRGQKYGEDVGEWWTSSRNEAEHFAMSRGENHTYVILVIDEDDREWLNQFLLLEVEENKDSGHWYRIPIMQLQKRWRSVRIDSGSIRIKG